MHTHIHVDSLALWPPKYQSNVLGVNEWVTPRFPRPSWSSVVAMEIIWKYDDGSSPWLSRFHGDDRASFVMSHDGSMGQTESGDDCLFSSIMTRKEHRHSTDDYTSESSIRSLVEVNRKELFVAHFRVIFLEMAWTPRPGQLLYERCNEHAALLSVGEQLPAFPAHLTNIKQSSATRYWFWLNYGAGRGSRTAAGSSHRSPGVA